MAMLAGGAARRESPAIDEIAHTGAGVSYWQKLDMRMNEEHPPLSKLIAAIPLAIRGAHVDYTHVSWTFSGSGPFHQYLGEWVFGHWFLMSWNDPRTTIWWARVPMILMTLVLGYVLFVFGSRLGGTWGGLLCLLCYATTPAFLAFGPLVVTDIVITLFWLLTVWQMPALWRAPSRSNLILFGLAFGGALLSKFSSGLLLLVFGSVAISMRFSPLPEQPTEKFARRKWRRRGWWSFIKGTAWALLLVYLIYFIFSWGESTDSFNLIPHFPASPVLRRLLMPVWIYLKGLAGFAFGATSRPTYLLGHSYPHGVWFYFPVIFLLKSQLSFLLLLMLAVGFWLLRKGKADSEARESVIPPDAAFQWRCLWVSLVLYVVVCMLNRLDISVRHFLIAIAVLILMLAPLPRLLQSIRSMYPHLAAAGKLLIWMFVLASLGSVVHAYPYFLPYINSLGMGRPGYLLVNDSNLDWDQAFPDVQAFAEQHSLSPVLLDRYGFSEPNAYVSNVSLWNCQAPAPSDAGNWAIVSTNNLGDTRNCLWLMNNHYSNQPLAGGSLYAVQLPNPIPAAGQPGGPPPAAEFHSFGGMSDFDAREIFLACIRDPKQLQPTMDRMKAKMEEYQKKRQQHGH